jgi:RimJ/RimL family protein N-acetyltransferase/predicted DNA-binding protein with PD1-like motif
MEYKQFGDTYYVRMDRGDEIISGILDICRAEGIESATFSGIGGCGSAEIQTFIPETGSFETQRIEGMLELVSLLGNVVTDRDKAYYHHTHAVFSFKIDGEHHLAAGHMKSMTVLYTAEIELRPVKGGVIRRRYDEETGTGFWDFGPEHGKVENGVAEHGVTRHGTTELRTERLLLRRYRPDDAEPLHRCIGNDPAMFRYSGWNPYETIEKARETVRGFINSYDEEHSYSWVIEYDGALVGTVGAYDFTDDRIEVGISVLPLYQGCGYATEALSKVLEYLTQTEGIASITAWCASENIGSMRVMEKAGMQQVEIEENGLEVSGEVYNKLLYQFPAT